MGRGICHPIVEKVAYTLRTPLLPALTRESYSLGVEGHVAEAVSGLEGSDFDGTQVVSPAAPVDVLLGAEIEIVVGYVTGATPFCTCNESGGS